MPEYVNRDGTAVKQRNRYHGKMVPKDTRKTLLNSMCIIHQRHGRKIGGLKNLDEARNHLIICLR